MQNLELNHLDYDNRDEKIVNEISFEEMFFLAEENYLQNCLTNFDNKSTQRLLSTNFKSPYNDKWQLQINVSCSRNFCDSQLKTVFFYLQNHSATASMVSAATKIPHKNICRYKRHLEKTGYLSQVEFKKCRITGRKAWYLTTKCFWV